MFLFTKITVKSIIYAMFAIDNSSIKIIDFRSNNRQTRNFQVTNIFKNLMISNIYRFIVRSYLDRKTDSI